MTKRRISMKRSKGNSKKASNVQRFGDDGVGVRRQNERGAILILAMAYIIVVSVVVGALATWASGDLNSTGKFVNVRNTDYAASAAVEVAINNIRYTPLVGSGTGITQTLGEVYDCWGTTGTSSLTTDGYDIDTWCSTLMNLGSDNTRVVTISACLSTVASATCVSSPLLQAIVVFDDYPSGGSQPLTGPCTKYCGEGATLESWDWNSTAGLSSPIANTISVTSTPPQIPLVGHTYTTVSGATSGDTVAVTSATGLICSVSGAVVTFIADGNCTIDFNDSGNVNYQSAQQVTQTMSVGPLVNTITVNSTPNSPGENGAPYDVFSTATSGDTVVITSATPTVCTASGAVVSFPGYGSCTLNFNDPGDTDYQAAPQVQQTFNVAIYAPAGTNIQGVASPQNGYPNNGDSMQYTYNQTMNANSLMSTFTGSSTTVYVQLSRANGQPTSWQVCVTSNCSTVVNLGTVNMGDGAGNHYYITAGSTAYFNATMVMSTVSGDSVVTVTLGTLISGTITALNPASTSTTMVWTPSASATSTASNTACETNTVTEIGAPKANF
jgi:hypothetical protein